MALSSKNIAITVAVLAVIWIGSGLMFSQEEPAEEISAIKTSQTDSSDVIDVRVREFVAEDYANDVVVTGRSQASRSVVLRAETSGQIEDILIEEGDEVKAGQVLARIEVLDRQARLEEARKRVSQREIEYNAAKKLETKGFNSKTRLAETLADLEDARAVLKQVEIDLEKVEIRAPFDGIASEQKIEKGDYLSVGDNVFTIVDLDPIEFVGFVSERRIKDVSLGGKAHVEFLDGTKVEAKVSYIAPAADAQTRTFRIIVRSDNSDLSVKEGLTASLHIPVMAHKAHKISSSILSLNDEGVIGVKAVNDRNVVEFIPVKILADKADGMYVLGAPEKVRFITVGQDFVKEGQQVKPVLSEGGDLL